MELAIKSDYGVLGENDNIRYIDNEEDAIDMEKASRIAEQFADADIVDDKKVKVDKKTGELFEDNK